MKDADEKGVSKRKRVVMGQKNNTDGSETIIKKRKRFDARLPAAKKLHGFRLMFVSPFSPFVLRPCPGPWW